MIGWFTENMYDLQKVLFIKKFSVKKIPRID